jgi:hypothetical protein
MKMAGSNATYASRQHCVKTAHSCWQRAQNASLSFSPQPSSTSSLANSMQTSAPLPPEVSSVSTSDHALRVCVREVFIDTQSSEQYFITCHEQVLAGRGRWSFVRAPLHTSDWIGLACTDDCPYLGNAVGVSYLPCATCA